MSEFYDEKRWLWRFFEVNDYVRTQPTERGGGLLQTFSFPTPRAQWEAWFCDAMLWTIEEVELGNLREAHRGLIQAAEYRGRVGSPGSMEADIFTRLKVWFEDEWSALITERDLAMEIAHDRLEEQEVPFPARRLRR